MSAPHTAGQRGSAPVRQSTKAVTLFKNLKHRFAGKYWNTP